MVGKFLYICDLAVFLSGLNNSRLQAFAEFLHQERCWNFDQEGLFQALYGSKHLRSLDFGRRVLSHVG